MGNTRGAPLALFAGVQPRQRGFSGPATQLIGGQPADAQGNIVDRNGNIITPASSGGTGIGWLDSLLRNGGGVLDALGRIINPQSGQATQLTPQQQQQLAQYQAQQSSALPSWVIPAAAVAGGGVLLVLVLSLTGGSRSGKGRR